MPATNLVSPAHLTPAFRVGVTGARSIRADQVDRIQTQLLEVLEQVWHELKANSLSQRASAVYRSEPENAPLLRLISPLARGADRLAAEAAMSFDAEDPPYNLCVAMPYPLAVYESTFKGTTAADVDENPITKEEDLQQFRQLLQRAGERIELDGALDLEKDSPLDPDESYEAVGRFVARHCDLLIGVWNGTCGNGRGGSAEIIRYAVGIGVPVLWIHATEDLAPVWLDDIHVLRDWGYSKGKQPPAQEKLKHYLEAAIVPPPALRRSPKGVLGHISALFRQKDVDPLSTFYNEKVSRRWPMWNAYSWMMKIAGRRRLPWSAPRPPLNRIGRFWFDRYLVADAISTEYAARYRSSYVLTIALTLVTLALAAGSGVAQLLPSKWLAHSIAVDMGVSELSFLFLTLIVVGCALRFEWHEKSIEYRLLAELFRKQQTLASLGGSIPLGSIQNFTDTERLNWVSWLYAATERASPLAEEKSLDIDTKAGFLRDLIAEQLTYHDDRKVISHRALELFETLGTVSFGLVLACVSVKVLFEMFGEQEKIEPLLTVLGLLSTLLPAISAAFVALRSYAELQLLVEQSQHMISELKRRQTRLQRINLHRPLVLPDLALEAAAVASLMLQDLEGWGRLFRGKLMEAS